MKSTELVIRIKKHIKKSRETVPLCCAFLGSLCDINTNDDISEK
jgi:hypothetical protein